MKPITKIFLIMIFITCAGNTAKAQEPNFTVHWTSYCELQSLDSYYKVEWALSYIPTQSVIRQGNDILNLTASTFYKEVTDWDCDKDEYPLNYMWAVSVKRYQNDDITVSCSGEARSSYLRCSDLYDGVTLNVNMTYP